MYRDELGHHVVQYQLKRVQFGHFTLSFSQDALARVDVVDERIGDSYCPDFALVDQPRQLRLDGVLDSLNHCLLELLTGVYIQS